MSAIDAIRAERDEVAELVDTLEQHLANLRQQIAGLDEVADRAIALGLAAAVTVPTPERIRSIPAPAPVIPELGPGVREPAPAAKSLQERMPAPAPTYSPRRMTIGEAEDAVIKILKAEGDVERTAIIERVDCSRTTIDRALYALLGRGRVHRDAKRGRPTRYKLAPLKALTPVTEAPAQAHEQLCSCDRPQQYRGDDGRPTCAKCGKPSAAA